MSGLYQPFDDAHLFRISGLTQFAQNPQEIRVSRGLGVDLGNCRQDEQEYPKPLPAPPETITYL